MKTAAAYLRVSTENQAGEDKFGLKAQRDHIESWASKEGVTIVQWYADEGISGANMHRAGLQAMLQAAEEGLGTCMLGWFNERQVRRALALPASIRPLLLITVGKSAGSPPPRQRKSLEEITSWNTFKKGGGSQ